MNSLAAGSTTTRFSGWALASTMCSAAFAGSWVSASRVITYRMGSGSESAEAAGAFIRELVDEAADSANRP